MSKAIVAAIICKYLSHAEVLRKPRARVTAKQKNCGVQYGFVFFVGNCSRYPGVRTKAENQVVDPWPRSDRTGIRALARGGRGTTINLQ